MNNEYVWRQREGLDDSTAGELSLLSNQHELSSMMTYVWPSFYLTIPRKEKTHTDTSYPYNYRVTRLMRRKKAQKSQKMPIYPLLKRPIADFLVILIVMLLLSYWKLSKSCSEDTIFVPYWVQKFQKIWKNWRESLKMKKLAAWLSFVLSWLDFRWETPSQVW